MKIKKKIKKEEERKKRWGGLQGTAKAQLEAEVYNNNKKCDWEKKKKLQSLIRFHSANKIDNYNREGEKKKKK